MSISISTLDTIALELITILKHVLNFVFKKQIKKNWPKEELLILGVQLEELLLI